MLVLVFLTQSLLFREEKILEKQNMLNVVPEVTHFSGSYHSLLHMLTEQATFADQTSEKYIKLAKPVKL